MGNNYLINPFKQIENYSEMLAKLGWADFAAALFSVIFLYQLIPAVNSALSVFSFLPPIMGITIPPGTLIPPVIIAIVFQVVKLHDRLSDWFNIRADFDVFEILIPMAAVSQAKLSIEKIHTIESRRRNLMNNWFYKYASSTEGKSEIDAHIIKLALNQWTWYWMIIETGVIFVLTGIIFAVFNEPWYGFGLFLFVLVEIAVILPAIKRSCIKYALDEVEMILNDNDRKTEIKKVFDAI